MNKKILSIIFSFIFAMMVFIPTGFLISKNNLSDNNNTANAILNSGKLFKILPKNYDSTDYNIQTEEIYNFTPFNQTTKSRLMGKSWKPSSVIVGEDITTRHILDNITIPNYSTTDSESLYFADLTSYETYNDVLNGFCLSFWIYFDTTNLRTTEFTLTDGTNTLKWSLSAQTLANLLEKQENSVQDNAIFGDNVPYSWNYIKLPFALATTKSGFVVDNQSNPSKFVQFTTFAVTQDSSKGQDALFSLYDISIEESNLTTFSVSEKQDYCIFGIDNTVLEDREYYINEYADAFPIVTQLITYCWVGDTNYLANLDQNVLKELFKIEVVPSIENGNNQKNTFVFGSGNFKVSYLEYQIYYCLVYQNSNIQLLRETITAKSYGDGIWFESTTTDLKVGDKKKVYYEVSNVFDGYGFDISFSSSDDSILKIVQDDKSRQNGYIIVEAIAEGKATLNIAFSSERLSQKTDIEELSAVSKEFVIKEADSNISTTVVLMLVGLGLAIAGGIYFAIKAIIDARKLEVK